MKVKDIMSKPHTIDKSARMSEALDMMDKYHVRRLVVKHKDEVQGIVTLRSICGELGSRRKYNHPPSLFHVCDAVSNNFSMIGPEDDLKKAISMLKDVDCVVVVDGDVVGSITTKDVIRNATPAGTVSSIMKMPVVAPPDARVAHIRKLMMEKGVTRVPIMDGHVLVGLVSETDIAKAFRGIKKHAQQNRQDNKVEMLIAMDIMSVSVITVPHDTQIKDAAKLMIEKDIGALPVMNENNHVIGMITRRDIIKAI
ncbi:transcriptional regulator [Methanocella sp. CWC-04]|uniref:Transcriptional regulator n=1 Tax=Methanooceanicella nereidis TaxID=2052831 RepID=A0AAP2W5S5_9EURY|nr:CBS domain-containing protein [Methanocella sp. CWC-04]MCD1294432.1 transcriptional regulator [Methanocella sp. CWC-04]